MHNNKKMNKYKTRSGTHNKDGEKVNNSDTSTTDPFDLIDENNPTIKDVFKILKGLYQSVNFLAEGYEDFKNKIKQLELENNTLKMETESLHKRVQYMETDYYLEQQQKLHKHITIHGIPQQKNDEIENTIISLASKLNVNIDSTNIISCRTMNNKNNSNKTPIIIVEFNDLQIKQQLQTQCKSNGPLLLSQILKHTKNTNMEHKQIYINDYLCTYIKQLLEKAKNIQKQCNIKFVWSKNGKVYARFSEKTPIMQIRNYKDITDLEEESRK